MITLRVPFLRAITMVTYIRTAQSCNSSSVRTNTFDNFNEELTSFLLAQNT